MSKRPVKSLNTTEYDEFVAFLREVRQEKGISQEQLGLRVGQSITYVYKIETKERRVDVVELIFLAEAMEIDPQDLFFRLLKRIRPKKAQG